MYMIDPAIVQTVKQITKPRLPDDSYSVILFGSRVSGRNRRFSDIDIGILGPKPLPGVNYVDIIDALEQSDLPYRADVVDFSCMSDTVKKHALMHAMPI